MRLFLLTVLLFGMLHGAVDVAVSILPQQTFVKKIGKERVRVTLMVPPGASPHTYEPKASQMKTLSSVSAYFTIGVEFESVWLPRFLAVNPEMPVIDTAEGIPRLAMGEEGEEAHDAHGHDHDHTDPHVWLSPSNVAVIARNIYEGLVRIDPDGEEVYKDNLARFLDEIAETDAKIKAVLDPVPRGTRFMVFHPSWGYFADAYGLQQLAMEVGGKEPKPKTLIRLIESAREHKVRAIIVQPEFSDKSAAVLAEELNIGVKKLSPLAPHWSENLIELANVIAQ